MSAAAVLISLIVFLPALATLGIALIPSDQKEAIRWATLGVTTVVMTFIVGGLILPGESGLAFDTGKAELQDAFSYPWIPSFKIDYFMGLDGISLPLVVLTAFVSLLAMGASWSINKYVKAYCILFLILETGMLGVFLALDFFLFYVFWEVMLLPMYFLIGVWGGPRKEYAAIKFFLYTLFGSVLMLIAILMLYFNSDLTKLSPDQLAAARISAEGTVAKQIETARAEGRPLHTFNILAMQQMGQHTDLFSGEMTRLFGSSQSLQWWAFVLLFIGF